MSKLIPVALLAVLAASPAHAQSEAELAAIRQAALDYIEGWYTGDAERMERAVHPELAKRIVQASDGASQLHHQGADLLVASTRRGGGRSTPEERRLKEITVLDVYENAASVKIVASEWVDYVHLARWDGEWRIINVLWELKPQPETGAF